MGDSNRNSHRMIPMMMMMMMMMMMLMMMMMMMMMLDERLFQVYPHCLLHTCNILVILRETLSWAPGWSPKRGRDCTKWPCIFESSFQQQKTCKKAGFGTRNRQQNSIYHDLPWFTMIYHDLPWFTMIYHDLPWYTTSFSPRSKAQLCQFAVPPQPPKLPHLGANHPRPPKCLVWTLWPEPVISLPQNDSNPCGKGKAWEFRPMTGNPLVMFQLNPSPTTEIRTHARISRLRWNWARFGVRPIGGPNLRNPRLWSIDKCGRSVVVSVSKLNPFIHHLNPCESMWPRKQSILESYPNGCFLKCGYPQSSSILVVFSMK